MDKVRINTVGPDADGFTMRSVSAGSGASFDVYTWADGTRKLSSMSFLDRVDGVRVGDLTGGEFVVHVYGKASGGNKVSARIYFPNKRAARSALQRALADLMDGDIIIAGVDRNGNPDI